MGLLNSAEGKAERKRRETITEERLQRRFEEGDPTLRKTIFGNIKVRRTGGILVESAEGFRFYGTGTELPYKVGAIATKPETGEEPGFVSDELVNVGDTALLRIRQADGNMVKFTVPTRPIIDPTNLTGGTE